MQKIAKKDKKSLKKWKNKQKMSIFEEKQKCVCCWVIWNSGDGEVRVRSNS